MDMDWRVIRCRQCSQVYAGCRCWDLSAVEGRLPKLLEDHIARRRQELAHRLSPRHLQPTAATSSLRSQED